MKFRENITLNNGNSIPPIGLGVYKAGEGIGTISAVESALEIGYRLIDTAEIYGNEKEVGIAVRNSCIKREDIFITSKIWNDNLHQDKILHAFNRSLDNLNVEYIDLYLIHWPISELRINAYKQLEMIYKTGRAKNIGVSNFTIRHLKELLSETGVVPAVNQIEFSPFLYQKALLKYCNDKHIILEAYTPLARMKFADSPILLEISAKHNKTVAQVILRWLVSIGVIPIPKSSRRERIAENFNIFDFVLDTNDYELINKLHNNYRNSIDPESYI